MVKKTVTYTDYNGVERTEDAYFNLNELELVEMSTELPDELTDAISDNKNAEEVAGKVLQKLGQKGIIEFVKNLMIKSYGVKSEDGRSFIKNEKLVEEFKCSALFSEIVMELLTDDNAAEFINAIIPANVADKIAESNAAATVGMLPN